MTTSDMPRTPREATPVHVLRDPATVVGLVSVAAGLSAMVLGWRGVSGSVDVQVQLSYVASGGLAGLALLGIGCAVLRLQGNRWADAVERRAWRTLAHEWQRINREPTVVRALADHVADRGAR